MTLRSRRCRQPELKAIVSKRRDFEYLLRRRSPRKVDYLRYIKYELKVERQRLKNKKRLGEDAASTVACSGGGQTAMCCHACVGTLRRCRGTRPLCVMVGAVRRSPLLLLVLHRCACVQASKSPP